MARPEHLNVPNTPEGIRRINEMQEAYDKDPEEYERQERAAAELEQQELQQQRDDEEYHRQIAQEMAQEHEHHGHPG
jgi:hypothetical protein